MHSHRWIGTNVSLVERRKDDSRSYRDHSRRLERRSIRSTPTVSDLDLGHGSLICELDDLRRHLRKLGHDQCSLGICATSFYLVIRHILRYRLLGPVDRVRARGPALPTAR